MSDSNDISLTCTYSGVSFDVPFTSENINLTKSIYKSENIRRDRMVEYTRITEYSLQSDFSFELKGEIFDTFIESAVASSYTQTPYNKSWNVGQDLNTFSIRKNNRALNESILLTGCVCNTFNLTFPYNALATGSVSFAASNYSLDQSTDIHSKESGGLFLTSRMGQVEINGVNSGIVISEISIDISNNLELRGALGDNIAKNIYLGEFNVSGSVSVYLSPESYQLYKDSLTDGKTFSLRFWATSEDDVTYEFYIPNADFNIQTPSASGLDQDIMVDVNYFGLYSPELNTALLINKYEGSSLIDIAMNNLWPQ